jgi:hypothetical protein
MSLSVSLALGQENNMQWFKKQFKKIVTGATSALLIASFILNTLPAQASTFTKTFTANASIVIPAGATSIIVELWGGGGGSGGMTTDAFAEGGAAGGSYAKKTLTVSGGQIYDIVVGAGGTAGSATGPTSGGKGASSTFSLSGSSTNLALAVGGLPSLGNSRAGAIGNTTGNIADTTYAGGSGATSTTTNGGGGGEAGCYTANGADGAVRIGGSSCVEGGNGGTGATNGVGGAGTDPGGGGSGSASTGTTNRAGRAGNVGRVIITYTIPSIGVLFDNFDDNDIYTPVDNPGWIAFQSNATQDNINGRMEMRMATSTVDAYAFLTTGEGYESWYDMTSTSTSVQIVSIPGTGVSASLEVMSTSTSFRLYCTGSDLTAFNPAWGTVGTTTCDTTTHAYWRIREASGVTYFDTSADSITWNNFATSTNMIDMRQVQIRLEAYEDSSTATPGLAAFDNFNIVASYSPGTSTSSGVEDVIFFY